MAKPTQNGEKKFLFRFILSYSILLVIILIMGLYLYHLGIKDARLHLMKQSQGNLSQAVNEIDTSFRIMNTLCTQISSNSDILKLLRESSTTGALTDFYVSASDAMKYLTGLSPNELILPISDYYIYLQNTKYLLSSSFLNDTNLFYHMTKHYDADYYDIWLELLNSTSNYYKFIPLNSFTGKESTSFLYKIPISKYTILKNSPGAICFEIDFAKIQQIFANLPLFETGFLYVTDQNYNEIFHITAADTSASILLPENKEKLISIFSSYENTPNRESVYPNSAMELIDGKTMAITCITSSYNEWNYYLVQPSSMVFQSLLDYQKTYAVIIFLACLISFAIILYLSSKNVKPIVQIHSQLESSLVEQSHLQETLEAQKPIIYHSYLTRIMTGRVNSPKEMDYIAEYLKICTKNRKFCVLYITIHYDQETALSALSQQPEHSFYSSIDELLSSKFCEYFGKDILIYEAGSLEYALLLSNSYEETMGSFAPVLRDKFLKLHENLSIHYFIWILGGLGNRNSELFYTWKSYQQAAEAVSYAGTEQPIQIYIELTKNSASYYYPNELVERLTTFITSSNIKQVKELFKLIYHENYEERNLPLPMQKWFLSDLRNTLLKIRFSMETTSKNETVLVSLDELLLSKASNFESIMDIALKLTECFETKSERNKLILSIQQYIRENYMDSSLCLAKVSDKFDISESYFSYLFKVETKENFSDYLEQIRMEQAMYLLKTTTISINNLYLEVGYNNVNSFRRAFKKVYGISPRQARETTTTK